MYYLHDSRVPLRHGELNKLLSLAARDRIGTKATDTTLEILEYCGDPRSSVIHSQRQCVIRAARDSGLSIRNLWTSQLLPMVLNN